MPSSRSPNSKAATREDSEGVSRSEIFGSSRRIGQSSEIPSPVKHTTIDMLGMTRESGEPPASVLGSPRNGQMHSSSASGLPFGSPRGASLHSQSGRRMKVGAAGRPTCMQGAVSCIDVGTDICQQEIFGSPRRKRSTSPPGARTMRWTGSSSSPRGQRGGRSGALSPSDLRESDLGSEPRSFGLYQSSEYSTSSLSALAHAACKRRAASPASSETAESGLVAIFGTARRQLSPGRQGPGGLFTKGGTEDNRSFCWSPAPRENPPHSLRPSGDEQWPSHRTRRLARSGSPRQDHLENRKALAGESSLPEGPARDEAMAAAGQQNIFGSSRRQRSPAQKPGRGGSPDTRTWRWLGTSDTSPSERSNLII